MVARRAWLSPTAAQSELADSLRALRTSMKLPSGFPAAAEAEAAAAADRLAALTPGEERADLRDLELLTIDPAGSMDLDQAVHLRRRGDGYLLHYAIADLTAAVAPGGALDAETRRRGQTLYAPDGSVPLHPRVLSAGAASLLPGQERAAYVWRFALDAEGRALSTELVRGIVRSRARWAYDEAQAAIDRQNAPETLALLAELGPLRKALEAARGGASLGAPEEEVTVGPQGYGIVRRVPLPVEDWNAQVSLLTGMAAAELQLAAGIGLLRTMPPAEPETLAAFRAQAARLGHPWPESVDYGEYLRELPHEDPRAAAILQAAAALYRGAGYEAFDGTPPEQPVQAAIGAPYAHATAPLRRLADRWVLAICAAVAAGREVPDWARSSLAELPAIMRESGSLAGRLEAGAVDRVEAALLSSRIGEAFDAVVIATTASSARVQIAEPFVTTTIPGAQAAPGEVVRVRVDGADIAAGAVELHVL
ncbi:MAG: RNB domain-containing ribonuclease [Microbacteriaceae bacterium]|nr:RNB domain-containing ribonuclease [Microbacteriaceae bacterium]